MLGNIVSKIILKFDINALLMPSSFNQYNILLIIWKEFKKLQIYIVHILKKQE